MSKTFAPGVRTGWIAAPHPVRDKLVLLREAADLCPSNLTGMVVEAWLRPPAVARADQAVPRRLPGEGRADAPGARHRDAARRDWTRPTGAFYVWLTVPRGIDTSDLLAKAIQHRVAYVPGRGFYADGAGGDQLRLCFSYPSTDRIAEGVIRLGELLHEELELVRAVFGDDAPRRPAPPLGPRRRGRRVTTTTGSTTVPSNVAVLSGGISLEREVSLRSGTRVADALADRGHQVTRVDVDAELVRTLEQGASTSRFLTCTARPARTAPSSRCSS
jgi:hypothetical protein